ncbi:MAG TPA: hypothetical protein VIE15_05455 [Acidimicrobiales bacterium]
MGECSEGVGDGEKPNDETIAIARSSWNESVTTSIVFTPCCLSWDETVRTLSHESTPLPTTMLAMGTPLASSHAAEICASVNRSPGRLPPVTATIGTNPSS